MLELLIPGECVPKGRPRFTKSGRVYTPKKTLDYENYLKSQFKKAGVKPTDKAVAIEIEVYRQMLKSWSKKKREQALEGGIHPVTRPDVDNYIKSILDAGNGWLYVDDSQVVDLKVSKSYGRRLHVIIRLKEIEND